MPLCLCASVFYWLLKCPPRRFHRHRRPLRRRQRRPSAAVGAAGLHVYHRQQIAVRPSPRRLDGAQEVIGLRLSQEEEFEGADLSIHKIGATPDREVSW